MALPWRARVASVGTPLAFGSTTIVPFILGCTAQRTWKVPAFGNVTVNFGAFPLRKPELMVLAPVATVPPEGATAAGLKLSAGWPTHQ